MNILGKYNVIAIAFNSGEFHYKIEEVKGGKLGGGGIK